MKLDDNSSVVKLRGFYLVQNTVANVVFVIKFGLAWNKQLLCLLHDLSRAVKP